MTQSRKRHRRAAKSRKRPPLRDVGTAGVFDDVRCGDPILDKESAWLAFEATKFDTTAVSAGRRFHSPPGTNK